MEGTNRSNRRAEDASGPTAPSTRHRAECPLCRSTIETQGEMRPSEAVCPSCGMAFALRPPERTDHESVQRRIDIGSATGRSWRSDGRSNRRLWTACVLLTMAVGLVIVVVGGTVAMRLSRSRQDVEQSGGEVKSRVVSEAPPAEKPQPPVEPQATVERPPASSAEPPEVKVAAAPVQRPPVDPSPTKQRTDRPPGKRITEADLRSALVRLTGSRDKAARLWKLTEGDPSVSSVVLRGHGGRISAVALSPDGRWAVTSGEDSTALLWDLTAGNVGGSPIVLAGHGGPIGTMAFGPNSRWLVTAGGSSDPHDNTARLWDLSAADPSPGSIVLHGHAGPVLTAAISPNGRWVATAGADTTIRLHDLSTRPPGSEQIVLSGHEGPVESLAISPDGRRLLTGSHDGTARLWDLRGNALFEMARLIGKRGQLR